MRQTLSWFIIWSICLLPIGAGAWHDETHLAIAKSAGYVKWYNAAGPDVTKIKAGDIEQKNHYVNNPPGPSTRGHPGPTTVHARCQL